MRRTNKMKPSAQTMLLFYQQLGKLFYSIASVDGTVRTEEITKLIEIVHKEWIPIEDTSNEYGDDSAYQIEIVFDWLLEKDSAIGNVISGFRTFKKEHPSLFKPQISALILKTALATAESFSIKNKSELKLITELRDVLFQEH